MKAEVITLLIVWTNLTQLGGQVVDQMDTVFTTDQQQLGLVWAVNGVVFRPVDTISDCKFVDSNLCDDLSFSTFYLNNIKLTKEQYLKLGIRSKEVSHNSAKLVYYCPTQENENCIDRMELFVFTKLPIELVSDQYINHDKKCGLSNIESIQRKKRFLRRDKIEVHL